MAVRHAKATIRVWIHLDVGDYSVLLLGNCDLDL